MFPEVRGAKLGPSRCVSSWICLGERLFLLYCWATFFTHLATLFPPIFSGLSHRRYVTSAVVLDTTRALVCIRRVTILLNNRPIILVSMFYSHSSLIRQHRSSWTYALSVVSDRALLNSRQLWRSSTIRMFHGPLRFRLCGAILLGFSFPHRSYWVYAVSSHITQAEARQRQGIGLELACS